jgi:hypothetical protein
MGLGEQLGVIAGFLFLARRRRRKAVRGIQQIVVHPARQARQAYVIGAEQSLDIVQAGLKDAEATKARIRELPQDKMVAHTQEMKDAWANAKTAAVHAIALLDQVSAPREFLGTDTWLRAGYSEVIGAVDRLLSATTIEQVDAANAGFVQAGQAIERAASALSSAR